MAHAYAQIAFTDAVKAEQTARGSRAAYARREAGEAVNDRLGPQEAAFIAMRDSVYMATVSETGWPYIQHRGGAAGFIRAVDERTIEFPDYAGNRQYISVGNLKRNDRAALILMDYARRQRLKIYARIDDIDAKDAPGLIAQLQDPEYKAQIERAMVLHVEAFDWNCPQHITPRYTIEEVRELNAPLYKQIAKLEAEIASLKAQRR